LCLVDGERIEYKKYPPGKQVGDNQYVESPEMLREGMLALGRWHCHADRWGREELAGPGPDDLRYAEWINNPVVVFTRLEKGKCNVDYLTPEGVVIDLGNY
jgi:hypothetical protein